MDKSLWFSDILSAKFIVEDILEIVDDQLTLSIVYSEGGLFDHETHKWMVFVGVPSSYKTAIFPATGTTLRNALTNAKSKVQGWKESTAEQA